MNFVFRPFLILCLAMALLAQGTASACLAFGKGTPAIADEVLVLVHVNCHTDVAQDAEQADPTCSACAACCLGALLLASTSAPDSPLAGSVHSVETPRFWQTFVAEHLDPPPRQRTSLA